MKKPPLFGADMNVESYQLQLEFDHDPTSFRGEVRVLLQQWAPGRRLHAHELEIESVREAGVSVPFELHPESQELGFPTLGPGDHDLTIRFQGRILEKGLIGLYQVPAAEGALITSMMYPNGARRVFPCVDDPAYKAVLSVTVSAPKELEVIFNTPVLRREVSNGRQRVTFEPTPRMSTYLVYLALGRFARLDGDADGVRVSVASPPGRESTGRFALDHTLRVLPALNRYYGLRYPLPKLDLVSVSDFWAGAMENWGAIAFHETRLLVLPTTGARARRRVRETVTHEIAHQWFGNLVTMVWWNDFWLNESFATFVETKMNGQLYPDLDLWSDFFLDNSAWGFGEDCLPSSHPIEVEVRAAEELGEIADGITYGKGATVLAMIEAYLGEELFRKGVTHYLERHAYRNARSQDLWSSLEEVAEQPVGRIMERWVRHAGHPLVTISEEPGALLFRQSRFLLNGAQAEGRWPIPLTFEIEGNRQRALMEGTTLRVPAPAGARVLVNPGRRGFYRTRYVGPLHDRLLAHFEELSGLDRAGMLLDGQGLLLSGASKPEEYLTLLRAAERAPDPASSGEVTLAFSLLYPFLPRLPSLRDGFAHYFRAALERIGVQPQEGEPEVRGSMRSRLAICRAMVDPSFAGELAQGFSRLAEVPPDLRTATIVGYARSGGPEAFEVLRDAMFQAGSEEVARQMLGGLTSLSGPDSARKVVELALDPRMPASRSWNLLGTLAHDTDAPEVVWEWLQQHLREVERLLQGTPLLSKLLEATVPSLGAPRGAELRKYFEKEKFPEAERGITKGLELMEILSQFLDRARAQ